MSMGEKILNLRKARGWSQEELAEHIGVTRQAVSRWESGAVKPDADKIIVICDLFGVSADYLLREQYAGEGALARESSQPQTQLGQAVRDMTMKQWAALAALLFGSLIMFVLKIIHIMTDTTYYVAYHNWETSGFFAFLSNEELWLVWFLALAAALWGAFYLFVLPILKKDEGLQAWFDHSD